MKKPHSPAPWVYTEDELFYHLKDANGNPIGSVCKNATRVHAEANLLAILSAPEMISALRKQPAYGDDWKEGVRKAFACATGIVEHFLPGRKKHK